jgi:hydroxyacylglutathione hydrolase
LKLSIQAISNGPWKQNCYVVADVDTKKSFIVDPGSEAKKIQKFIDEEGLDPIAIVNTHGHFDHVGAVDSLMKTYQIPFFLSGDDAKLLKQANIYKILFEVKDPITIPQITTSIGVEDRKLSVGPFEIIVIATPGHTKGSVCLIIENEMFSGDTIFSNQLGRTDLPGGSSESLLKSADVLRDLDGSLNVWPGHGKSFRLKNLWANLDKECNR